MRLVPRPQSMSQLGSVVHCRCEDTRGPVGATAQVGRAHILAAMAGCRSPVAVGDTYLYVADDDRGIELEIVIVPDDRNDDGWVVIHAMPTAFREQP